MTATPIPRTLALTAYGDLDVTVLRELPAGRRPIETHVASTERERARAYERIREELRAGRQAFVVCPLVEESEALQARAATAEYERLRTTELRDFRVVLLHGQMQPREKQEAMAAFAAGGADVLVATTVIEVGIDVPNASVMLVEGAERYGISQLHQLRGRIGRGAHESVCLLFGPKESPRLRALAEHRDGFKLAEIDLELRGEGEMLGTRQSGLAQFRVARLPEDAELLDGARRIGAALLEADPELALPEHALLDWAVRAPTAPTRSTRSRREPVRVIAGRYGGRRLQAPPGAATRPTADRVREALFSILGARVAGARVLDLFAGSGALGIEALSRGAAQATFVDSAPAAAAALRANLAALGADAEVVRADALRWLRAASARRAPIRSRLPRSAVPAGGGAGSGALGRCCPRCWRPARSWSPSPTAARRSS